MSPGRAGERGAGGRRFLAWLAILALAGVAVWLASERNARRYYLVLEDGLVAVKRGLLAPIGRQPFKTDDPQLLQAYAPFKPPAGAQVPDEQTFDDRAGLDQALYGLLARWARDDIQSEKPELLERGMEFVSRAERLAGISAAQREDLRALRAESSFLEARRLVEQGTDSLRRARERLRISAQSTSVHAGDAAEALKALEPALDQIHRAGRLLSPALPGPGFPKLEATPSPGAPTSAPPAAPAPANSPPAR